MKHTVIYINENKNKIIFKKNSMFFQRKNRRNEMAK